MAMLGNSRRSRPQTGSKPQNVGSIQVNFFCFLAMSVTFGQLQTLSGHESSPWAVDGLRESDFLQEKWEKRLKA
jgi:hypothetical protein